MSKIIPKKMSEKIVKLRDHEGLSWATIRQQTDLHWETVRKQYPLEKGKGVSPFTTEKVLVTRGKTAPERLSVKQEFELLAKRQEVVKVIDDCIALIEGEEWDYVEDEVCLLQERLDLLESRAESAKDVDTLSEIQELLFKEVERLRKLGKEQGQAENKTRERERNIMALYYLLYCWFG